MSNPAPSACHEPWRSFPRFCHGQGRENLSLARIQSSYTHIWVFAAKRPWDKKSQTDRPAGPLPSVVGAYSLVGAAFALPLSRRWRLKSAMEANLYVPSLVSASIEPSAKIL